MGTFVVIVLVVAVAFGLLALVFAAGRTLERSEIGRSKAMRERGIRCTAEWMRSLEQPDKPCDQSSACGKCTGCLIENGELKIEN